MASSIAQSQTSFKRFAREWAHLATTTKSARKRSAAVCGAPAAAARRGHAFWDHSATLGHPHLLRLILRTKPRSGGGSKKPHANGRQNNSHQFRVGFAPRLPAPWSRRQLCYFSG